MHKLLIGFACLVQLISGQTTLRLRYGGTQSSYRITAISSATPAVLTVRDADNAARHSLVGGDEIYIHLVQGCRDANGYRKVALNPAPTAATFAITDLSGKPIRCNTPFDYSFQSGYVGKYHTVTLNQHPRLMTPKSGSLRDRNIDRRAAGGKIAGVTVENGPAWRGMLTRFSAYASSKCDGITSSRCQAEESTMHTSEVSEGWDVLGLALVWQADQKKTAYLNATKYYLNHADRLLYGSYPGFACDTSAIHCGVGSFSDWISASLVNFVKAYDIVRNELTAEQRQRFANLILNGWSGTGCTNQLVQQSGTVDLNGAIATGSGLAAIYHPGDSVYFKTVKTFGRPGVWATISKVTDTELTLTKSSGATAKAADHYKVTLPWDPARSCGVLYAAGGHGAHVGEVSANGFSSLAVNMESSAATLTVKDTDNFLDPPPYYLYVDNEVVLVTAAAGGRLTVVRGQLYTSPAAHPQGRIVAWYREPRGSASIGGPNSVAGGWEGNLTHQRAVGYVMAGLALADDDPRAAELAEKAWNYFYELIYPWCADFWSGPTGGGQQDWGYQWGRWQANMLNVVLAGQFAFSGTAYPELLGDYFWSGLLLPAYWSSPGSNFDRGPNCPLCGDSYTSKAYVFSWIPLATTFHPGPAADGATWWWRYLGMDSGYPGNNGIRSAVWIAPYYAESALGSDFRKTADPWNFNDVTEFGPDRALGLVISRSDWTKTATFVMAALGFYEIPDHAADQSIATAPGSYMIHKGAKLLFGGDSRDGSGSGSATSLPWFRIAGKGGETLRNSNYPWWSTLAYGGAGGPRAKIDRRKGSAQYVYARGNMNEAFRDEARVTRSYRSLVHLKGTSEYVIIFDDHAAAQPDSMSTKLYYFKADDLASDFHYDEQRRAVTFVKPTGSAAMLNTALLFPDGRVPAISTSSNANVHSVAVDWGSTASAQMFTIHRTALGVKDAMPPVSLLKTLDSGSIGLEIDDGDSSRAVLYSKSNQDRTSVTFSTTFTGKGYCVVTGLTAGKFDLVRGGAVFAGAQSVGSDGSIGFECDGAGNYRVARQ